MIGARIDSVATFARSQPDAPALADLESGRRWTYRALDRAADGAAAWLAARLGPASGERVAVLARNCAEMLILHLGCVRAGAVFVPLNWRLAPVELAALIADAGPNLLFHDDDFGRRSPRAAASSRPISPRWRRMDGAPPAGARRAWTSRRLCSTRRARRAAPRA